MEFSGHELATRAENFRWNVKQLKYMLEEEGESFVDFAEFNRSIREVCETDSTSEQMGAGQLEVMFQKLCHAMVKTREEHVLFLNVEPEMVRICAFVTLCGFLHNTKRLRGKSLRDFVLEDGPGRLEPNGSKAYVADVESEKLRKDRTRLLSQGKVYVKNTRWNAMSKDSMYEWGFYFDLAKESYDVQDVFKRQKNLYSDIRNTMKFVDQDGFEEKITEAYKKFRSKLKKLEYSKYVELQKAIKTRILDDLGYYGINLYRFERRMRPYTITHEVKRLEKCNSDEEEIQALLKMVWLDDVCFPSIYERLFDLPLQITQMYAEVFSEYLERTVILGCLILDELVEQGAFGDAWEKLFIDVSNKMAETVLYDPEKINFEVTEKSQQKFMRILHASVLVEVCAACHRELEPEDLLIE